MQLFLCRDTPQVCWGYKKQFNENNNLFTTSEPPKYSNSPHFFFQNFIYFFKAHSKEFIDGASD